MRRREPLHISSLASMPMSDRSSHGEGTCGGRALISPPQHPWRVRQRDRLQQKRTVVNNPGKDHSRMFLKAYSAADISRMNETSGPRHRATGELTSAQVDVLYPAARLDDCDVNHSPQSMEIIRLKYRKGIMIALHPV